MIFGLVVCHAYADACDWHFFFFAVLEPFIHTRVVPLIVNIIVDVMNSVHVMKFFYLMKISFFSLVHYDMSMEFLSILSIYFPLTILVKNGGEELKYTVIVYL